MLNLQVVAAVHSGNLGCSAAETVSLGKQTCLEVLVTYSTVVGKAIVCTLLGVLEGFRASATESVVAYSCES